MNHKKKTKEQLISELVELRQRIAEMEISEIQHKQVEEKAFKESEERLRTIIEASLDAIIAVNEQGNIVLFNPAAEELFLYSSKEVLNQPVKVILREDAAETHQKRLRQFLKKGMGQCGHIGRRLERTFRRKDGTFFEAEVAMAGGRSNNNRLVVVSIHDITEHKRVEHILKESEERAKAQYKGIPIPTYTWQKTDNDFVLIDYNLAGEEITQGKVSDWLGAKLSEMYKDMPNVIEDMRECFNKKTIIKAEMLYKFMSFNKERYFIVHYSYAPPDLVLVHTEDITERKRTEEVLKESEERYRAIFEDSREAIYITTREGRFVDVNQSALDLFGYTREEIMGLNMPQIYANPADQDRFQQEIEQKGSVRNYEVKFRKKNGMEINCLVTSTVWKAIDGTILGYQGIIRDITEIKKVEEQLRYLSLHDPLTGLYNRAYFEEEMRRLESGRYDSVGIIMCDVDGLKLVNDALGHHTGDKLLIATANILKESFREGDVVARVGGDEFAVLVANFVSNALEKAYHRIQVAVARHNLANPALPLGVSLGFAVNTTAPIIMSNLFKEADNNMYREKLQHSLSARSTIVQTLMKALETKNLITKGRVDRLQKISIALAQAIGLPDQRINDLRILAEFHDIGKVGIPEHILLKLGPLTPEEIIEIQKHCEIGHRIAMYTPDLVPIADLILKHHEWWNGEGYPLGIKGEEIPIECRILSIAGAYEAMISDRPYHKAMSREGAVAEITRLSGTKFDPEIVSKFIQVLESLKD